MKEIRLTQNKVTLVDDKDYEWLSRWKWYAKIQKDRNVIYAARSTRRPFRRIIFMHAEILGIKGGDHVDGDGLNNQRGNLRAAPRHDNAHNMGMYKTNTSGYKGVDCHKDRKKNKWYAGITNNQKRIHIACFDNAKDAALAYDARARELFGDFARTNFDETGERNDL